MMAVYVQRKMVNYSENCDIYLNKFVTIYYSNIFTILLLLDKKQKVGNKKT